jgi:hypothetical protein
MGIGWMEQGTEATTYIYIIYHSALAASTLIILFSEMLKFLKKKHFCPRTKFW